MPAGPEPLHRLEPGGLERVLGTRFTLCRRGVEVDGRSIELVVPDDMDTLLAQLADRPPNHPDVRDERLPYWAEIWPSALALARFASRRGSALAGRDVLEIGCGLGLPGIVAASLGARTTWTDYLPDAAAFAALNAWRRLGRRPDVRIMDWRRPDPALAADLVLAADVLYETRSFEPLARAFEVLLRPGGEVWLAEPRRAVATGFFRRLPDHGLQDEVLATVRDGLASPVVLHRITRSAHRVGVPAE